LAIQVKDGDVVKRLSAVVREDWKKSRALDLSDRGLQLDLKRHGGGSLERVAFLARDSEGDGAVSE